jgi:ketosteroid isomerase-like protein
VPDSGPDLASGVDVVRELGRRFGAGDRDGAMELYHPQVRIELPYSLPHGGVHRGREGVGPMAEAFAEHWERTIENPRLLDAGDQVVQITTQTWTAKTTGRSATVDVVELFAFADGMVSEIRVFQQDTHRLLETLDRAR